MPDHLHASFVEGCFRCDLSRDEAPNPSLGSLTEERLAEIEALANAATEGPWDRSDVAHHHDGSFMSVNLTEGPFDLVVCYGGGEPDDLERCAIAHADAAFIAAASSLVPELVDEVRRLRAEIQTREADLRETIAADFDRLAGNRNPDDIGMSRMFSDWAMHAAERIRHPERASGVAATDEGSG